MKAEKRCGARRWRTCNAALNSRLYASVGGGGEGGTKFFKVVMFAFEKGTFWKDIKDHLSIWLKARYYQQDDRKIFKRSKKL